MLLGIKTDGPTVEFCLYHQGGAAVANKTWEAGRTLARNLLRELSQFLVENDSSFETLSGLFVFRGPGSFTGLRIGITVMNTLAYAQKLPIVGEIGERWTEQALGRLTNGENDHVILPEYGAAARITASRR